MFDLKLTSQCDTQLKTVEVKLPDLLASKLKKSSVEIVPTPKATEAPLVPAVPAVPEVPAVPAAPTAVIPHPVSRK